MKVTRRISNYPIPPILEIDGLPRRRNLRARGRQSGHRFKHLTGAALLGLSAPEEIREPAPGFSVRLLKPIP